MTSKVLYYKYCCVPFGGYCQISKEGMLTMKGKSSSELAPPKYGCQNTFLSKYLQCIDLFEKRRMYVIVKLAMYESYLL
jgi:hypothetical protein